MLGQKRYYYFGKLQPAFYTEEEISPQA